MPSPIAHASVAFLLRPELAQDGPARPWRHFVTAGLLLGVVWGADVDFIPHFLMDGGDLLRHGGPTHSLVAGVVAALLFATLASLLVVGSWGRLFLIGVAGWWTHLLMDVFTRGGGIMLLWPFSTERIRSPLVLFYGANHSEPLAFHLHMITLANEVPLLVLAWWLGRRIAASRSHRRPQVTT